MIYIKDHNYVQNNIRDIENISFTADIISFFNDLFDSLNGFGHKGSGIRHALSLNSNHIEFWNNVLKRLDSIKFDSPVPRVSKPLSLRYFIHDIKSIKCLWSDLRLIG